MIFINGWTFKDLIVLYYGISFNTLSRLYLERMDCR
jgi:hypothetical protein